MPTPYREPGAAAPQEPLTLELLITTGDRGAWLRKLFVKLWISAGVLALVGVASVWLVLPVGALLFLWMKGDVQRRRGERVTVRTVKDRVQFDLPEPLDIPMRSLLDVRLDTKSQSKAIDQPRADGLNWALGPAIPDGRSIAVDVSRIELFIQSRDEPVLLSEMWISNTLALENLRQVKVMLRKAGWLPADERPRPDPPWRAS